MRLVSQSLIRLEGARPSAQRPSFRNWSRRRGPRVRSSLECNSCRSPDCREGRCYHRPSPSPHPPPHHHTVQRSLRSVRPWVGSGGNSAASYDRNLPQSSSRHRRTRFRRRSSEPCLPSSPSPEPLGHRTPLGGRHCLVFSRAIETIRAKLFRQVPSAVAVKLEGRTTLRALYRCAIRLIATSCDNREDAKRRPAMPLRKNLERL